MSQLPGFVNHACFWQQTLELGGLLCKLLLSSLDNHSKALFEIGLRVKSDRYQCISYVPEASCSWHALVSLPVFRSRLFCILRIRCLLQVPPDASWDSGPAPCAHRRVDPKWQPTPVAEHILACCRRAGALKKRAPPTGTAHTTPRQATCGRTWCACAGVFYVLTLGSPPGGFCLDGCWRGSSLEGVCVCVRGPN